MYEGPGNSASLLEAAREAPHRVVEPVLETYRPRRLDGALLGAHPFEQPGEERQPGVDRQRPGGGGRGAPVDTPSGGGDEPPATETETADTETTDT